MSVEPSLAQRQNAALQDWKRDQRPSFCGGYLHFASRGAVADSAAQDIGEPRRVGGGLTASLVWWLLRAAHTVSDCWDES